MEKREKCCNKKATTAECKNEKNSATSCEMGKGAESCTTKKGDCNQGACGTTEQGSCSVGKK